MIATCFYTPLKLATTIDLQRSKGLGKLVNGSLNCIYIYICIYILYAHNLYIIVYKSISLHSGVIS